MPEDGKKTAMIVGGVGLAGLGVYLLVKKPALPKENIVLSDLTIEPSEVYVGEPVEISVTVTNTGGLAGSYEIACEVM